jgi:hypothetical protein
MTVISIILFIAWSSLTLIFTVNPMQIRRLTVKLLRIIFSIKVGDPNSNSPVQERQPNEC